MWERSDPSMPHSNTARHRGRNPLPKKGLITDLDNTLWGGIVGEDGWQGLRLDPHGTGAPYIRLQAYLKDLAEDCAADGVYEFMFVAPAIPITGAVGSPTNPLAIK